MVEFLNEILDGQNDRANGGQIAAAMFADDRLVLYRFGAKGTFHQMCSRSNSSCVEVSTFPCRAFVPFAGLIDLSLLLLEPQAQPWPGQAWCVTALA